jgi:hypothetical protein
VDRSVTGLVAQQQCVGPLQLPLANCAVLAQSHFTRQGIATAVGEQPIKGLLSPAAMARLTVYISKDISACWLFLICLSLPFILVFAYFVTFSRLKSD